ncbi:serine/threonine protein kinase [Actinoplanes palleronii]|nr:serine/threonine-protein kinase [Actinoplanes palleronii]
MGRYELIGRLGEGGMGTVYLAVAPEGRRVAVKVIKAGLADDPQFRQRFRSEVERAQAVPPFCTAEVLDADPEHQQPYLVVEYVDGPSLATVVAEQGPLTSPNLHSLAIGVATALTAIHGAGVIHRDLKPGNVLLAPGSPKVIDFGIARAVEQATQLTRAGQVLGTVAYMAPERFDEDSARSLTPAADIFAWGAVIAYAGTGRSPFAADMPHMVAVRIMTMPPNLDGLPGSLRDLVEQALAKDPADRPTARELLDRLLHAGPQRAGDATSVLNQRPALREAVADAQAADDRHAVSSPASVTTRFHPRPAPVEEPDPTVAVPAGGTPGSETTRWVEARPQTETPKPRQGLGRTASVVLAFTAVVAVSLLAGIASGLIPVNRDDTRQGASGQASQPPVSPSSKAETTPEGNTAVADPLTVQKNWRVVQDTANKASCSFDGALVVTKKSSGPYRCLGPRRTFRDFTVTVTTRLLTGDGCAAVWLRFGKFSTSSDGEAGHLLAVCADGYRLMTHGLGKDGDMAELAKFPYAAPVAHDEPITVGITAKGDEFIFTHDGKELGTWQDSTFTEGRVVLGVLNTSDHLPASVSFNDIDIRT